MYSRNPFYFYHLIQRQMKYTLFPYTTLFRSKAGALFVRQTPAPELCLLLQDRKSARSQVLLRSHRGMRRARGRDRKSTRLNSSHLVISYAVFCMKKKIIYKNIKIPLIISKRR